MYSVASFDCTQGGAGAEATSMGFGCASEDAGATLALFSEVIRAPALAQPKVDLYKAQVHAGPWRCGTVQHTVI